MGHRACPSIRHARAIVATKLRPPVHVDPQRPMAWTRRDVKRWIERIVARGLTVVLSVGHKHTVLRADLPNMRRKRRGGL